MNVSQLSAISANLGTITAGSITSATYTSVAVGASSGRSLVIDGDSSKNIKFYFNTQLSGFIATNLHTSGEDEYLRIQAASGRSFRFRASRIEVNGNFAPDSDNAFTCGTSADRWSDGLFEDITVDDLTVNDSLDKPGGSFKIDHPLKPKTHILRHSFVESPDMMNIYKGRVSVVNGKATITLPDYFEALNMDFEYSLTPIKVLASVCIKEEVKNNKFKIIASEDCDVSWVVYGVRHDRFADENRIIVEEEKEIKNYMYSGYTGEARNRFDQIKGVDTKKRKEKKKSKMKKEKVDYSTVLEI